MHDVSLTASRPSHSEGSPYLGGSRGRAVAALSRGVRDSEGPLLLTGSAGVGKSTVLKAALAALADQRIRVISLSNPGASAWGHRELAGQILGRPIEASTDIAELTATRAGQNQIVIAVDDAQTLTSKALELLLLIASPARGGRKPPRLILAGRSEFLDLQSNSLARLIDRADRVTLEPLSGADARDYIAFRLTQLGCSTIDIIAQEALAGIARWSFGLPGRIDQILASMISIGVCHGGWALTGEMVEAAIAALPGGPDKAPERSDPGLLEPGVSAPAIVTPARALDPDLTLSPTLRVVPTPTRTEPPALPRQEAVPAEPRTENADPDLAPRHGAVSAPALPDSGQEAETSPAAAPDVGTSATDIPAIVPRWSQATRVTAMAAMVVILAGGFALLRGLSTDRPSQLSSPPDVSSAGESSAPPGPAVPAIPAPVPSVEPDKAPDRQQVEAQQSPEPTSPTAVTTEPARVDVPPSAAAAPDATPPARAPGGDTAATPTGESAPASPATPPVANVMATPEPAKNAAAPSAAISVESSALEPAGASRPQAGGPPSTSAAEKVETSSAPADGTPSAAAPGTTGPAISSVLSAGPRADTPGAEPKPSNAAVTLAIPTRQPAAMSLPPEVVNTLLQRGDAMLRSGDILAARLFYERAAASGSGLGATGAGKTYDPDFLASIDAPGPRGDVARAIDWYRQASMILGDGEASERLKVLTARTGQ